MYVTITTSSPCQLAVLSALCVIAIPSLVLSVYAVSKIHSDPGGTVDTIPPMSMDEPSCRSYIVRHDDHFTIQEFTSRTGRE